MVHSEEEALGTRLTIDSLTCLLANETDPSRLVAVSPGKLMRYLVQEGGHISKDQPYVEIEVRPAARLLFPIASWCCCSVPCSSRLKFCCAIVPTTGQGVLDPCERSSPLLDAACQKWLLRIGTWAFISSCPLFCGGMWMDF